MTLSGNEPFTANGKPVFASVFDFWKWAYSDLGDSTTRSRLAEFIVNLALFKPNIRTREEVPWCPYNILSPSGRRVDVRAAAYIQAPNQEDIPRVSFNIAPRRSWHPVSGISAEARRHSDICVFCVYTGLLANETALNLDAWDFYVIQTSTLDREMSAQKTIFLSSLLNLAPIKCDFKSLQNVIEETEF